MIPEQPASGRTRGVLAIGTAATIAAATVAMLAVLVLERQGNLAWDDADYLRRGLRLARLVDRGGIAELGAVLDERPKPPLYVAWIEAAALCVGRDRIGPILVMATAVPIGLVLAAAIAIARARYGPGAGVFAVLLIAASPMTLAYGAKVMVETLLALWLLLAVAAASATARDPSGRGPWILGAALGLAAMTKATVALFLPPIVIALVASPAVRGLPRRGRWLLIARVVVPAALIAGPWYAGNGAESLRFARHASRYVVEVEGRDAGPPVWSRPLALADRVAGWPVLATVMLVALGSRAVGRPAERREAADEFGRLSLLAAAFAGVALLGPSHFDPRFLLPIWPAAAVALAGWMSRKTADRPMLRAVSAVVLAAGIAPAARELLREPPRATPWAAASLLDELTGRYGVRSIANVGDSPDWNVCKTGLVNELRDDPGDCFVLHDLSRLTGPTLGDRLGRVDALLVLNPSELPPEIAIGAPGLNRALAELDARPELAGFDRIEPAATGGIPHLTVLVRREFVERSGSGSTAAKNRASPTR